MRIIYIILVLCCGIIVACDSEDTTFPREETISQELMPLQGITYPIRVEVRHPFLILQNMKRTDSLFHVYDLTNYELKQAFGQEGQGPDDFVSPWLFHSQLSDIIIGDTSKDLLYLSKIGEDGINVLNDIRKSNYIYGVNDAAFINDSLFVVDAMYMAPDLYLISLQDKLPKKTKKYRNSNILDYYIDPDMGRVYANESRIAYCYGYKKQIDFMDIDLNLIKRVKFKYKHQAVINGADEKVSYVYGYFGKRYLYVLFFGTSWNEYRDGSVSSFFLEVYDLEGNPVVRYRLDGNRPVYFAVDEEGFTLYGAGDDGEPEDNLLVYKLKGL